MFVTVAYLCPTFVVLLNDVTHYCSDVQQFLQYRQYVYFFRFEFSRALFEQLEQTGIYQTQHIF